MTGTEILTSKDFYQEIDRYGDRKFRYYTVSLWQELETTDPDYDIGMPGGFTVSNKRDYFIDKNAAINYAKTLEYFPVDPSEVETNTISLGNQYAIVEEWEVDVDMVEDMEFNLIGLEKEQISMLNDTVFEGNNLN